MNLCNSKLLLKSPEFIQRSRIDWFSTAFCTTGGRQKITPPIQNFRFKICKGEPVWPHRPSLRYRIPLA